MAVARVRNGKKHTIKVVASVDQKNVISKRDKEMDARATQAVKSAVAKAKFCKKPVAKYDTITSKAYIEYADGAKKYVE